MEGFIDSFKPFFTRYKSEVILLGAALIIGSISFILFLQQKGNIAQPPLEKQETRTVQGKQTITIDISGAVKLPFVYTFDYRARIIDVIQKAGGLTEEADEAFVKRNFNYARILSDQEKIYVPFLSDTTNGYISENKRIIDYTQPNSAEVQHVDENTPININAASLIELDQLPGIGKVQSETIINNRPYTSIDDLVKNNVIKQSVYDKIKDQISVY
jgi:competence protein ComEA